MSESESESEAHDKKGGDYSRKANTSMIKV